MRPHRPRKIIDRSSSDGVRYGSDKSVPIHVFRRLTELSDGGRVRHVRLHSTHDDGTGVYVTVHRFWLWTTAERDGYERPELGTLYGPHLFAEGTQLSRSRNRPPVEEDPAEVSLLYNKIRRARTVLQKWDYWTAVPIPKDRPVDGPLPDAADVVRMQRHEFRRKTTRGSW